MSDVTFCVIFHPMYQTTKKCTSCRSYKLNKDGKLDMLYNSTSIVFNTTINKHDDVIDSITLSLVHTNTNQKDFEQMIHISTTEKLTQIDAELAETKRLVMNQMETNSKNIAIQTLIDESVIDESVIDKSVCPLKKIQKLKDERTALLNLSHEFKFTEVQHVQSIEMKKESLCCMNIIKGVNLPPFDIYWYLDNDNNEYSNNVVANTFVATRDGEYNYTTGETKSVVSSTKNITGFDKSLYKKYFGSKSQSLSLSLSQSQSQSQSLDLESSEYSAQKYFKIDGGQQDKSLSDRIFHYVLFGNKYI